MNDRSQSVALGVGAVATAIAWVLWAGPWLTRIPDDFHYEADIFSHDDFYDEKQDRFTGEILSYTQFHYEVVERRGDVLSIENVFEVGKATGERIFGVKRLYGIDRWSGRHVTGAGDRAREGYLFAPRRPGRAPFTYWHVNYDAPARMAFVAEERVLGLAVDRYSCDYEADQTQSLGNLPGVPGERGVRVEVHLDLWIEPWSGFMVKYEDQATAHFYDQKTGQRLRPWNRFGNRYTEASVAAQVARARLARRRALWAGPFGVALCLLTGLLLFLRVRVHEAGGVGAVLTALRAPGLRLRRRIIAASAALAMLVGLAGLAGWALGIPALLQVRPGLAPMALSTAVAFGLGGLALGLGLTRHRGATLLVSSLVLAVGAMAVTGYLLGVEVGVDRLVAPPPMAMPPLPPRMAPMTAACFALLGIALLVHLAWEASTVVGVLGAVVVAAGVVTMGGYLFGLPQAYRLGPFTSMALHSAAAFVFLGTGLLAVSWPSWEWSGGRRWVVAVTGVSGLFALVLLHRALDARETTGVKDVLGLEAKRAADGASNRMNERILALRRMALRWSSAGGTPQAVWERDAAAHYADLPGFQALSFVDPSRHIRWLVPLKGNEQALGRDLSFEGNRRDALEEAARTREVAVSRPLDLLQGGRGFLVCVPLFTPAARFDGFITGVFRYDKLMDVLVRELAAEGHLVTLWDGGEAVYRRGPARGGDPDLSVAKEVRFEGGAWRLTVQARPEWSAAVRSSLPEVTLGAGLVVLALASLSLGLAWRAGRQAVLLQREVEAGAQREARFRGLLEGAPDAIVIADSGGRIVMVNAQTETLFGYERAELLGQPVELLLPARYQLSHPGLREAYFAAPHARPMGAGSDLHARHKDGSQIPVEVSLSPLRTPDGILAISAIRDVGEQRQVQQDLVQQTRELEEQRRHLREQSVRDPLTGCHNRRYLDEFAKGQSPQWGCLLIDVDYFKQYNETHGHQAGDDVLVTMARFLQREVRAGEMVVRMGGDEFLVLLPDADEEATAKVADRLRAEGARCAPVPFTLGWAARRTGETLEATIHRADGAMFGVRAEERVPRGPRRPRAR